MKARPDIGEPFELLLQSFPNVQKVLSMNPVPDVECVLAEDRWKRRVTGQAGE